MPPRPTTVHAEAPRPSRARGESRGTPAARAGTERERFLADVLRGLSAARRWLPPKWFYDGPGCELYGRITRLPEYYLTRTEAGILGRHLPEIARAVGPRALVFEYGAGGGEKALRLLAALDRPAGYLPVEMSAPALAAARDEVQARFPALPVRAVQADFAEDFALPAGGIPCARRLAFFPGSTVGNFDPAEARRLLSRMARHAGRGGRLLLGVDLRKDRETLERAYDDAEGVTAAFDLNLLARINRELSGDFRLEAFRHRARWDAALGRVEMHLESLCDQVVHVAERPFAFRAGETIHTESSYKWDSAAFDALAARAGWRNERTFTDERGWFAVKLFAT
ncbi:MAG TPA: L-histidine N(alpha)-methyltransferase [Anaeromyxobacteraceae bacterium]|nr:L-histidine N(alpha)-methyltransferase [Anaeromyxobacteraceae bacterium]